MMSSNPNTIHPSRDGLVPRASHVLDPRPLRDSPNGDLWSKLYNICYQGRMFIIFMSILLGDDQALDEDVTSNKRGAWSGTNHDTMQLHGGEFANPTTTLWLPEILKSKGAILGYKTGEDFLKHMKMVFQEVMKFGVRATNVAKAFAKMEFYLVKHMLFNVKDLQVAFQAIVKDMETKLPIIDPLLLNIEPSNKFILGASYIPEPQPPRVSSTDGDHLLQLRAKLHQLEQFYIFLFILLGEDQHLDEYAIVHNNGGTLSGIDHYSQHGEELLVPTTTFWLCEYLKKRDTILNYNINHCKDSFMFLGSLFASSLEYLKQLKGLFKEVMKYGARATDVAKAFARMEIDHVEYLFVHPEDLQLMLQHFNTIAKEKNTRELIKMFIPNVEFDLPLDAPPNEILPNIEPLDNDYIKLRVLHHFGKSKDK